MKKIISLILIICISAVTSIQVTAKGDDITVKVNNKTVNFDVEPMIQNDYTLVPMRAIFEKLGAEVLWHEDQGGYASASKGDITIWFFIGKPEMLRADETHPMPTTIELDIPAQIVSERTLVPLRAISEALNCDVEWVASTRTVLITTPDEDNNAQQTQIQITPKPQATERPAATSKPKSTPKPEIESEDLEEQPELTYNEALNRVKLSIEDNFGNDEEQAKDITIKGEKTPKKYKDKMVYEFELYSKSIKADDGVGHLGTCYVECTRPGNVTFVSAE